VFFVIFGSGIISLCCLSDVHTIVDPRVLRNWDVFAYVWPCVFETPRKNKRDKCLIIVDCYICLNKYSMISFQLHLVSDGNFVPVCAMKMYKGNRCMVPPILYHGDKRYGEEKYAWKNPLLFAEWELFFGMRLIQPVPVAARSKA
jgi:hypothetical protein